MKHTTKLALIASLPLVIQSCSVISKDTAKDVVKGATADAPWTTYALDKAAPTIIYVHGCGGVDGASLIWARRMNSWGYNVVIADDLTQKGPNPACASFGIQDVGYFERMQSVVQTAQWVGEQPWHSGRIGIIGFGLGGTTALNIGANTKAIGSLDPASGPIKAGVSYYPHCQSYHANPNIPMQIHIGNSDDWTRSASCLSLNNYEKYDANIYDGAHHGFDTLGVDGVNQFGHRVKYDEQVSRVAEQKTRVFFERHIKSQ